MTPNNSTGDEEFRQRDIKLKEEIKAGLLEKTKGRDKKTAWITEAKLIKVSTSRQLK